MLPLICAILTVSSIHIHRYTTSLKEIKSGDIDWELTSKWIKHNPLQQVLKSKLSRIISRRIKSITFTLPTGDINKRNYPSLYPQESITCPSCLTAPHNDEHLGLCTHYRDKLISTFIDFKKKIKSILHSNFDTVLESEIDHRVDGSLIFNWLLSSDEPYNFSITYPVSLILHNFIPRDLTYFFQLPSPNPIDHTIIRRVTE